MIDFVKARQEFLEATKDLDNNTWSEATNPFLQWAPTLNRSHLEHTRIFESREALLRCLPKNGVVAEVGTQYGHFAVTILSITDPLTLHIIDVNLSSLHESRANDALFHAKLNDGTVQLHQGDSSSILLTFPNEYFDWIYIDADHSYEGVQKDIYSAFPKLKKNGMLVFNDYTNWSVMELIPYGVARAVNEFCIAHDWEFIFFALHGIGYHDVAIRKKADSQSLAATDHISALIRGEA